MKTIPLLLFWFSIFVSAGFVVTYVISRFFKNKYIRLTPSFIVILLIIYSVFKMTSNANIGFDSIGYFLMFLFFVSVLIGTFIACFIRRKK